MDIYGQQKGVHDIISIEFIALKVGPRISHLNWSLSRAIPKYFVIHIYRYVFPYVWKWMISSNLDVNQDEPNSSSYKSNPKYPLINTLHL